MSEPTTLYSPTGTWATVTTPSAVSELIAAGWTRIKPANDLVTLDPPPVPVVPQVTTKRLHGRPKKGEL